MQELVPVLEQVQELVPVLEQVQELVPEQVQEMRMQPSCLPVLLLILRQILIFCSICPPF